MADGIFNVAKGRVAELHNNVDNASPANCALILVLLKVSAAEATLKDQATLAAILAGGSTECDFTNYARKTITGSGIGPSTTDNTNDWTQSDITADPVWTAAGGGTNNNIVRMLVCYDNDTTGGSDSNIIPLTYHDLVQNTNGGDITAQINANGYYRAS